MMKKNIRFIAAFLLAAFALLTLFLSSSIILDLFGIRDKEGDFVLTIVWANFISSIMYLFAAYGFMKGKKETFKLLGVVVLILICAFIAFGIHIYNDGIYMTKTIGAMIFRIVVTLIFAFVAYFTINKRQSELIKK